MNKIELSSERLFVVKPSIVTLSYTEYSFKDALDASPSHMLSKYQIRCVKANIRRLKKREAALDKKTSYTEAEKFELANIKNTISNLEKIDLEKPTISDYIKNIKWRKMSSAIDKKTEVNLNHVTHIVEFETRPEETTIAYKDLVTLKALNTGKPIHDGVGYNCEEEDLHVGVCHNDKVLLARYLWEQNIQNTEYDNEIEKYLLFLKPFYSAEEIIDILRQLKKDVSFNQEDTKVFRIQKERKKNTYKPSTAAYKY